MDTIVDLEWSVSGTGYAWVEADQISWEHPEQVLAHDYIEKFKAMAKNVSEQPEGFLPFSAILKEKYPDRPDRRLYRPFEKHKALFKNFASLRGSRETFPDDSAADAMEAFRDLASLRGSRESIVKFANQYGFLGVGTTVFVKHPVLPGEYVECYAETDRSWAIEIEDMREAVSLWEMTENRDLAGLSELISWDRTDVVYMGTKRKSPFLIVSKDEHPLEFESLERGDLVKPALLQVTHLINSKLKNPVVPRFTWNQEKADMEFLFAPKNLLDALWIQFALAVTSNKEFRQCAQCGRWFDLNPKTGRTNRVYCSDACSSKAYRERKAADSDSAPEGRRRK